MRAFVLSGGGSLGAVQAGMLQALLSGGITPDLVVGASVGALNGALLAGRPDPVGVEELVRLWRGLRRADVFRLSPRSALWAGLGRGSALLSSAGLGQLIDAHLRFSRIEDAAVPLVVVATDLADGSAVVLREGSVREALLASAAVPGLLPAVSIVGRSLVDGAVSDNTPVSVALDCGADEVWVLPSGYPCALPQAPSGAVAVALQALTILVGQRLARDLDGVTAGGATVRLVPPLCPLAVAPHDFSRSGELIERATASTAAWLAFGAPALDGAPEHLLQVLPHRRPDSVTPDASATRSTRHS